MYTYNILQGFGRKYDISEDNILKIYVVPVNCKINTSTDIIGSIWKGNKS